MWCTIGSPSVKITHLGGPRRVPNQNQIEISFQKVWSIWSLRHKLLGPKNQMAYLVEFLTFCYERQLSASWWCFQLLVTTCNFLGKAACIDFNSRKKYQNERGPPKRLTSVINFSLILFCKAYKNKHCAYQLLLKESDRG